MLLASVCFAGMGLCVKLVADAIPVAEIVFFRSLIATAIAAAFGWRDGRRLLGVHRRLLLTRGIVGLASMFAYFYALSSLKLGDAVLLTYLSPLVVAAMSPYVLGERAPPAVWLALAIGFAGVGVVAQPTGGWFRFADGAGGPSDALPPHGVAAGLASAILAASAYVSVKVLSRTDGPATIVLWFSASATVVSGIACLWQFVVPDAAQLAGLAGVGVLAALAQLLMTRAYAVAAAAEVSVYAFATPVIAYLLGHAVLREPPGWRGTVGAALLALAGLTTTLAVRARSPRR